MIALAGLSLAASLYAAGWLRLARRAGRAPATARLVAAMSALAAAAVALASPLDGLAHERLVAHMVQHLLLVTVAAPLALLADPFPVVLWALPAGARRALRPLFVRRGVARALLRAVTSMPVAWTLFVVTLWLWHLPALYERALAHGGVHVLEHATFVGAALAFWWPLLGPAPRVRRGASPAAGVVYTVLAGFQSAALGLALMLWPSVLYPSQTVRGVAALDDQAWGGVVMWSVSGLVDMGVALALLWRSLTGPGRPNRARLLDPPRAVRENSLVSPMVVRPGPSDPAVRFRELRKAYAGHLVLDGVDLDIRSGEAVALLGANGAGKTTLLRIAATLARPTGGRVLVAGADCAREPETARRHIGFLAHGSWLYEDLTALENLRFWATLGGVPAGTAVLREALASVELERWADARVRAFSAGMKRRLSVARLLMLTPRVLLLDEPFTGLDQQGVKWLTGQLQAFKSAGGAVLMSTHSFGRGFDVVDRAAVLAAGRIAADVEVAPLGADGVRRLYEVTVEDGA